MARLLTEGFEAGGTFPHIAYTNLSISTTKRSGSYAAQSQSSSAFKYFELSIPATTELYIRCGVRIDSLASGGIGAIKLLNGTTVLDQITFAIVGVQYPSLLVSTSVVATSTTPLVSNTWHLFEAHLKVDNAGVFELKQDGIQTITYSGDTQPGLATTIDKIQFGCSGFEIVQIDDIAINDITGAVDNSWIGDGHVIMLKPDANGDSSQLTGSDGNSTDNYLLVDDVPSDGDTTYVQSATAGQKDLYNLSACGLSNVVIGRVWAEARAIDTGSGGGQVKLVTKAGATETDSAALTLSTSYAAIKSAEMLVNPADSAAWEVADLDALQVGVKIVS